MEATHWRVNSLLKALHHQLKDTPARRNYYEAVRTKDGPMPFEVLLDKKDGTQDSVGKGMERFT